MSAALQPWMEKAADEIVGAFEQGLLRSGQTDRMLAAECIERCYEQHVAKLPADRTADLTKALHPSVAAVPQADGQGALAMKWPRRGR